MLPAVPPFLFPLYLPLRKRIGKPLNKLPSSNAAVSLVLWTASLTGRLSRTRGSYGASPNSRRDRAQTPFCSWKRSQFLLALKMVPQRGRRADLENTQDLANKIPGIIR